VSAADIAMAEFDSSPRPSRRLWVLAGFLALALHLGFAALTLMHLPGEVAIEQDTLGAQATAFGVEMTSPEEDDSDLPKGEDTDASVAAHASVDQEAVVKETELPKDMPTKTDDPDQIVTPSDVKKPEETDPKAAAKASAESVAREATARQTIDDALPKSDVATAPHIGLGKDAQKLKAKWDKKVVGTIQAHLRYPKVERKDIVEVIVEFTFDRLGRILSVKVAQSSNDPKFDEAAISTIRRSGPLPPPPAELTDETFSYTLPMKFAPPSETQRKG